MNTRFVCHGGLPRWAARGPGGYNKGKGATRFRRKLWRLEGMPDATCPQSGGKTELPTLSWLWLPRKT